MGKLVGVIAGTPVDTQMGVDFLIERGIEAKGYPISKDAKEQSRFQLLSKDELHREVVEIVRKAKLHNVDIMFAYCNSLSAAVDMERVSRETDIDIITPFSAYIDFGREYSSLLVLAANGQSCGKIESVLEESNRGVKIWSISALPLVQEIETRDGDSIIFNRLNLELILKWAELNEIEGIVLGCTHFPYMSKSFHGKTTIPILDPAEKMLQKMVDTWMATSNI